MYSLAGYGEMIADDVRMSAYRDALRRAIRPGCVVIDLGAGAGIMACLAVRFGASRVYAIEPSDAIGVAREIAQANGLAERIRFIQDTSDHVELPERADILVSDLRGVLPPYTGHFAAIGDARRRLLKVGGKIIPALDTIWAAAVEAPELYERQIKSWRDGEFNLAPGRWRMANIWSKARVRPEQLLTDACLWATVDYRTVIEPAVRGSLTLGARRGGLAHGLALWFDAELLDEIGFSNAPDHPEAIYGHAFFPFPEPTLLSPGDVLAITIRADFVESDYLWSWDTAIHQPDGTEVKSFRQSEFHHLPLSAAKLRTRASSFTPTLNREGEIDGVVLSLFGTGQTLGDIAKDLATTFPDEFGDWKTALDRVARLSAIYGA